MSNRRRVRVLPVIGMWTKLFFFNYFYCTLACIYNKLKNSAQKPSTHLSNKKQVLFIFLNMGNFMLYTRIYIAPLGQVLNVEFRKMNKIDNNRK